MSAEQFKYSLEATLRKWMPKDEAPDRMKFWRAYLTETLHMTYEVFVNRQVPRKATPEEVATAIATIKARGFTEAQSSRFGERFLPWLEKHRHELRQASAKKAAKVRWKAEASKKKTSKKAKKGG